MDNKSIQGRRIEDLYRSSVAGKYSNNSITNWIITRAIECDVPIHRDQELITKLAQMELNRTSPEEYYLAIAEVVTYIKRINKNFNLGEINA